MDVQRLVDHRRKSYPGLPLWFKSALVAAMGTDTPLPLITRNGVLLGMVCGHANGRGCDFVPAGQSLAYNSYDNLVASLTAATPQKFTYWYEKNQNATVINNNWYDLWPIMGNPTQGTFPGAARTAVQFDDTSVGALPHGGNVSPQEKYLLSMLVTGGSLSRSACMLYDRVLTYEACTMTAGSQAMTNVLTAQRYAATGQPGLRMSCIAQTNHNATAADLTVLNYTDNTGAGAVMPTTPANAKQVSTPGVTSTQGGRVTCPAPPTGTATASRGPWLPLAAGTTGARAIVDYTWSAAPTGTNYFLLAYPLAMMADLGTPSTFTQILDLVNSIGGPARVYDGACVSMLWFALGNNGCRFMAVGDFGWTA